MFKLHSGANVPSTRKTDARVADGWDGSTNARPVDVRAELLPPQRERDEQRRAVLERDEIPIVTFRADW